MEREAWLNGWERLDDVVLIGTMVHCVGCGREQGLTCVAFSEEYEAPEKLPEFPFDEEMCPVCKLRNNRVIYVESSEDKLTQRLIALKGRK